MITGVIRVIYFQCVISLPVNDFLLLVQRCEMVIHFLLCYCSNYGR